jgi:hypothetical protein
MSTTANDMSYNSPKNAGNTNRSIAPGAPLRVSSMASMSISGVVEQVSITIRQAQLFADFESAAAPPPAVVSSS